MLNESVNHILLLWFLNFTKNNIYQLRYTNFLNQLLKNASENIIMILLFKINLLSSLINLYRSFVINDVSIKILKMDSVLFYIKYIVIAINKA